MSELRDKLAAVYQTMVDEGLSPTANEVLKRSKLKCTQKTTNTAIREYNERNGAIEGSESPSNLKISQADGGFSLQGKVVLAKKPTSVWPARLRALKKNTGYRLESLADQWGASVATVREKAREQKCLRYIEIEGEYVVCVVHPETKGGK